jgi:hypothetical protein
MSDEKYHEWRGSVIATLKSLNHNDDILSKNMEDITKSIKKESDNTHKIRIACEKRITSLELSIKSLENTNKILTKLLIGLIIAILGGILGLGLGNMF